MVYLIEDELKRALVRNEISHVYEILLAGKIPALTEENIPVGATVLHIAALLGYQDCVQTLLSKSLSDLMINFQDENTNSTPLMHAISTQERKIAKLLLVSGKCDVNLRDGYQQSALHLEAQGHSPTAEIAFFLVKYGADIDAKDAEGMTPLLRAVEANNMTVAKFLYGQRCDMCCEDNSGRTALHIAAQQCHEDILQWLIRIGCAVNKLTLRKQTPLMLVVVKRRPPHLIFSIMKHLTQAGVSINAQDYLGNTALLLATMNAAHIHKHHIALLLACGADPDLENRDGLTPLWQAVYDGIHHSDRLRVIELLVGENCALDTSCRGHLLFMSGLNTVYSYENNMSPFEVAMDSGFFSAAKLLLLAGAIVTPELRYDTQYSWFLHLVQTPPELQHTIRLVLRALLGRPLQPKVRKLPLPERIKSYVMLEDLIPRDTQIT